MIDAVIRAALANRVLVLVGALALLVWGSLETLRMPVDVFPDLTAPTVTVMTDVHGIAPEEMEREITFPLETALNGAAGVRRVRSSTAVGIAVIRVEFEWGTDILVARQIVSEKLQLAAASLPPEVPPPVLAPVSSIMGEVMFVAVTSDAHTPMEVRTTVDWQLRRRLLAVPGVSQVVPIGGEQRQFQVVLDPDRLHALDLDPEAVLDALAHGNENTSAGFHVSGGQEFLIRGIGRIYTREDIAETVVTVHDGVPITVGDVARVRLGAAPTRGTGAYDAAPAVIVGIQKQPGINTLELTRRLDAVLDELQDSLPAGMTIERHIFRQADFIGVAVDNVAVALRDGAILVVVIVLVFLTSLRATLITALAIPLSLLAAVLALDALGGTLNTMTLGGMAIAVGALVDDAIIDVENVVRRLRLEAAQPEALRRPVLEVVFAASKEIRGSIVFATLIIVLVFLPLFFLPGVEGRMLEPLGFAYIVSLAASLLVALTVTPVLCLLWLPRSRAVRRAAEPAHVEWLGRAYDWLLRLVVRRWLLLALPTLALLVVAVLGLARSGRAFLPDFNEGTLTISAVTAPGTAIERSDELGRLVEETLHRQPEVVATARRTGRAELDEHAQGVHASEIDVSLRMGERSKDALLAALRKDLATIPGMNITIGQPIGHRIDHMLSGTRSNIAVKIFGRDLATLRELAEEVRAVMEGIEGVVDLSVEQQVDIPLVTIRYRREALGRYGLRVVDLSHAIETAFGGRVVSTILDEEGSFELVVRYAPALANDLDAMRALLVRTPVGAWVALEELAEIRRDMGPNTISRENAERLIVVSANVAERDIGSVVDDIRAAVRDRVSLPDGYHVEYGGQFEAAEAASRVLFWLGLAVVAGVFVLLFVAFGSLRDATLVMLNLPLALIGGVAGVYVAGGVLSIAAIIGFITLFGVATRNGIMLVAHIRHLVQVEGEREPLAAVRRGARERLAPILMTALASGLGLLPLALAAGAPGAEIQAPMAIVILCGLVTSTLLNMFLVPALYLRFGALRTGAQRAG